MIAVIASLFAVLWAVIAQLRPNVEVDVLTAPQPSALAADTTTWFVAGLCDLGRTDKPILVTSINDFTAKCGARVSYSVLYDALDTFFREGGYRAYVGRVVGPGATKGTANLLDGTAAVSLVVNALGPGASSANIKVGVLAGSQGGTYQLQVLYNNVMVEQSPDLGTQADAATWAAANSDFISVTVGAAVSRATSSAIIACHSFTRPSAMRGHGA